jgi:hypothetical protein
MTATTRRQVAGGTLLGLVASKVEAGQAATTEVRGGESLLTVFLRHDETKTLAEINEHLKQTGFFKQFPPPGIEVVSWYVMMGIGQVVTLNVPPDRLREVNRVLEQTAWGGFHTEFYPTYDYRQGAAEIRKQMQ